MSAKDIEIEKDPLELTDEQKKQNASEYNKDKPLSSFLFVKVVYQKDNHVGKPRGYYLRTNVEGRQKLGSGMEAHIFEVFGGGSHTILLEATHAYSAKKHEAWAGKAKQIEGYEELKTKALDSSKRRQLEGVPA